MPLNDSLFSPESQIYLKGPNGTFRPIGMATGGSLGLECPPDGKKWWEPHGISISAKVELSTETREALRKMLDEARELEIEREKATIRGLIALARKMVGRFHIDTRISEYRTVNSLVHKYHNMNFTRYCKSVGIRRFNGFRVRLESGSWVRKK